MPIVEAWKACQESPRNNLYIYYIDTGDHTDYMDKTGRMLGRRNTQLLPSSGLLDFGGTTRAGPSDLV
jgi:hypothetical protein